MRTITPITTRPTTTRRPLTTTSTTTTTPTTEARTISNYISKMTHMPIATIKMAPKQQGKIIDKQIKLQSLSRVDYGNSKVQPTTNLPGKRLPVHIRSKVKHLRESKKLCRRMERVVEDNWSNFLHNFSHWCISLLLPMDQIIFTRQKEEIRS